MWTQLWSDIPSRRVALTAETCHQALSCSSALAASSSRSRRRLPRVGARTRTLGEGLARRDRRSSVGSLSSRLLAARPRECHHGRRRAAPRTAQRPPPGSAARRAAAVRARGRSRSRSRSSSSGRRASSIERPRQHARLEHRPGQPAQRGGAAADGDRRRWARNLEPVELGGDLRRGRSQLRRRRRIRCTGRRRDSTPEPSGTEAHHRTSVGGLAHHELGGAAAHVDDAELAPTAARQASRRRRRRPAGPPPRPGSGSRPTGRWRRGSPPRARSVGGAAHRRGRDRLTRPSRPSRARDVALIAHDLDDLRDLRRAGSSRARTARCRCA